MDGSHVDQWTTSSWPVSSSGSDPTATGCGTAGGWDDSRFGDHAVRVRSTDDRPGDEHPLDNAAWWALTGPQASLAVGEGRARRYHPEVTVFGAVESLDDRGWADLAAATGPEPVALFRAGIGVVPASWEVMARGAGHQMTVDGASLVDVGAAQSRRLRVDDVPAMLDLVALTIPGPFLSRTIEMGRYHGHFDNGRLVAMAGERVHLPGHTEISAVCTHPDARGRGLAAALTHTVARGILERSEQPFLHVADTNHGARRVYERLGFTERTTVEFALVRTH